MPILTEPSNCLEDTNEARPLQRILQAEKRNHNDTGRHYSSYSKSSLYEEDNRRYDIKRSSQNNYQSKGEERRNAEQRSRNVEIYDKREHRGHRDEVSRANRYVRNNSNEKFYYEREKSKKSTGKSERERVSHFLYIESSVFHFLRIFGKKNLKIFFIKIVHRY